MRQVGMLVLVVAAWPGVAATQEFIHFRSPSGNIDCMLSSGWSGAGALCAIREGTLSFAQVPDPCPHGAWGHFFSVGPKGAAAPVCVTEGVSTEDAWVLPYGAALSLGGVTCTSLTTGMTCANAAGHGFTLARRGQQVF